MSSSRPTFVSSPSLYAGVPYEYTAVASAGSTVLAPTTDIRGVRRDARPDVGAFEAT